MGMADEAELITLISTAAKAFVNDYDVESMDEDVPVTNYASMTDAERESHLDSFKDDPDRFAEEYEKCFDCRVVQVPRRKEETGYFSFLSYSTKTLVDTDAANFISDLRTIEEENELRDTPLNIHLFIDTVGGKLATAEAICKAILQYDGKIVVFVADKAMSAGTMIALCGHEIYLRSHAQLGQIDPQIGSYWFWIPANSVEATNKRIAEFETPWIRDLLRGGMGPAQDANSRVVDLIDRIVEVRQWPKPFEDRIVSNLLANFMTGGYGHDKPYDYYDLKKFWDGDTSTDNSAVSVESAKSVEPTESHNGYPPLYADWPKSAKILMRKRSDLPRTKTKSSYLSALGL